MIRLVTDSASDVTRRLASEYDITVIPLSVRFGSQVYRDGEDLTPDDFYSKLVTSPNLPVTSAPAPGEFAETYDRLAEMADGIISIHVSSKLSATYEAALQGKSEKKSTCPVELVDSLSGAMGEGLVVIATAKAVRDGASFEEALRFARTMVQKSHVHMCFDTLEFLKKGGRIGKAQALLGSMLRINPIIGVDKSGEVHAFGRERSRSKAVYRLYEFAQKLPSIRELAVEHASTPEEAEDLADRIGEFFPREQIIISQVASAVGTHVGPHVISVSALEQ